MDGEIGGGGGKDGKGRTKEIEKHIGMVEETD